MEDLSRLPFKEIVKAVRKELKEEFPELKFSVRQEHSGYMPSLYVSLMEAPWDALTENPSPYYDQINWYLIKGDWNKEKASYDNGMMITPEAWEVLKKVNSIIDKYRYDNSDPQIDYFDMNFYFYPEIGQWNKPFKKV